MKNALFMGTALLSLLALGGCNRNESTEVASNEPYALDSEKAAESAGQSTDSAMAGTSDTDRTLGETIDDAALTGKVKTALTTDDTTKARQINVTTFNGTVELSGFVDSSTEKQRAEEVARSISGVKEVRNELEVGKKP